MTTSADAHIVECQTEVLPAQTPMRLIRLPEVISKVGIKRSTIYQRMAEGRFPKGRAIGPKSTVWVESEIDDWIRSVVEI
ncbi:MAG: AlpA family transcriptional regulator [Sphingomonadales bacterium]|nr:AlpA family transcriptional regulator [Sphingomonadales bacterium]